MKFDDYPEKIYRTFNDLVNLPPKERETWLETEDSRFVGWTHEGESEAVGHQSGRRILEIRDMRKDDLTENDVRSAADSARRCRTAPARRARRVRCAEN